MGLNLHTHLEGWVRPETAADLAARWASRSRPAAGTTPCGSREPADLTVFLAHVAAAYPVLGHADAMRRVAREAVEDAAADGCDFLEIRFGPSTHARPGFDRATSSRPPARASTTDASDRACPVGSSSASCATSTTKRTSRSPGRPPPPPGRVSSVSTSPATSCSSRRSPRIGRRIAIAAAAGLGLTAHAAEAAPAAAAVEAVATLGVSRIGHGSHIADDPDTLAWAARRGSRSRSARRRTS